MFPADLEEGNNLKPSLSAVRSDEANFDDVSERGFAVVQDSSGPKFQQLDTLEGSYWSPPSGTPEPKNASANIDILNFICPWPNAGHHRLRAGDLRYEICTPARSPCAWRC